MNLSDKVYYVECHFDGDRYSVKESTVGKVFRKFKHPKKDVFENFKHSKNKQYFKLSLLFSSGYLLMQKFYFDKNDAIKEALNNLDEKHFKVIEEYNNLNDIRNKLVSEMS